MKYTATELARLALYVAAAAAGIVLVVYGAKSGDMQLVGAGVGLLGTGTVAGAKVNKTKAPPIVYDPDELPRPGVAPVDEDSDFDADPIDAGYRDLDDDDEDPKHGA